MTQALARRLGRGLNAVHDPVQHVKQQWLRSAGTRMAGVEDLGRDRRGVVNVSKSLYRRHRSTCGARQARGSRLARVRSAAGCGQCVRFSTATVISRAGSLTR